jgi:3-oxoacyl-[acyl-carrier-protein] synthase-3
VVASSSAERRFPGPATAIAAALGLRGTPAIDLPMASAGSLFGVALAARLAPAYGNVLVIGTEIMSRVVRFDAVSRDTAVLFGDGAGACLVSSQNGFCEIVDSALASDGEFTEALRLETSGPVQMDGRTIILQAARKLPRTISELLLRNGVAAGRVRQFLLHQANGNLLTRVARALAVPEHLFFRNLERYGNTSSASLLIAAAEWRRAVGQRVDAPVVFAAFGAGLNWGAVLACP